MKKCPFCAEEIQDEAIKCRHCGEFLDGSGRAPRGEAKSPWYFKTSTIWAGIIFASPFIIPLIVFNPKFSITKKVMLTLVSVLLTVVLAKATIDALAILKQYYEMLPGGL